MTKRDLLIEVWEYLDCESVGAKELQEIQREVSARFGAGAVDSPASIARTLADEGAVLRHPEILECDTAWREEQLSRMDTIGEIDFTSLDKVAAALTNFEMRRREFAGDGEQLLLQLLADQALEFKREAQLRSRSKVLKDHERQVAREVAEWLTIWLQDPELFDEWLSLRRRSPEFIETFGYLP